MRPPEMGPGCITKPEYAEEKRYDCRTQGFNESLITERYFEYLLVCFFVCFFFSADGSSIKLPRERREYIEANDGERGDREEVVG